MAQSRLSQSPYLPIISSIFGTLALGFGINGMLRPRKALAVFEFEPPASAADQKLVDSLIVLYGVRDVFMGLAVYSTTYFGNRKALGWILIAGSGVAFVDGIVSRAQIGRGEWNHWGYAPVMTAVGSILLGVLDRSKDLPHFPGGLHAAQAIYTAHLAEEASKRKHEDARNQDLFLDILESAATKREAKAYLSRFTPQKSALSSLSALPSIDKEVGVNLGNLYRPMRSMDEKPVLSDTPAQPSLTKEPVELLHVALVKIRAPQSIQDETLQCVSHTLSQLARLGLSCVVVVDIEDGQDRSDSEGRKLAIEQAKRIVDAVDIFGGPGARFVDTVIGISPVREQLQPLVRVRGGIRITHRNLLLGPLRGGIIPVVAPIGFAVDTQKLVPVVADEVVLALTRDFAGIHIQPLAEDDPNAIAEEITSLQNQISLDRVIVLDPLGGIPSTDSIHGSHVFINIEQEFDAIKKDLLGTNDRTFSLAKTSRSDLPGTDSANAFELSDPFSKVLASESRTAEHPAQEHTTLAKATSRRLSMGFHVKNLELLRSSLALLPPSSSAFLTTPEAVANSRSRPPKASRGPRVRTRRQRNPLIHNLLTDKPVFSSSLPAHRSAIIVARTSMPVTSSSPATFFKRGMPVGIIPDPVEHAWVPPSYLNPPTDLSDSRVDLSRLIHLIDDSFDRTLDVPKYLVRVKDCIAGVIIAGEYEGGAILTWESPPGVSPDKSNRMVPYLDKFAVLKRSQGAGGVADVVFKSMVRDCFPNGVCWRSRMGNPVNKWYFERAIGTWKMPVTNWTMFWTTEGVEKGDEVFKDYEAVCKAVLPTWADKKRTVD